MNGQASRPRQGVQSVEIGLSIVAALAEAQGPMALRDLSRAAGLPPSNTHRYLVSLCRAGLLRQNASDSRYDLGPFAVRLGLVAQSRLPELELIDGAAIQLSEETGQSIAVMSWTDRGPLIIRGAARGRDAISIVVRLGSTVRTLNSTAGRLFAAYSPPGRTEAVVRAELRERVPSAATGQILTPADFAAIVEEVRETQIAVIKGDFRAGVDSIGVPVFGADGDIRFAIAMLCLSGTVDLSLAGKAATAMRSAAATLSRALGHYGQNAVAVPTPNSVESSTSTAVGARRAPTRRKPGA